MMGCTKALYKLISTGDKDAVIRYMERYKMTPQDYHDNNYKPNDGADLVDYTYYPVSQAAILGQLDIMNTLIERGFDPDNKDLLIREESRPINCACYRGSGHLDIVKCLIEDHNVNMNFVGLYEDGPPLLNAIEGHHTEIVKYLVESGAIVNDLRVLHECVRYCDPSMVEYILSKSVDVNERDVFRETPLFNTVYCHFPYTNALVLLDAGADVDAKKYDGNTTFLQAAEYHKIELMRLLISRGEDANVVNNYGDTALHMAIKERDSMAVNVRDCHEGLSYLVVELGLECLNTRNSRGITPIARALMNRHGKSVLELLVNYGSNITDEFDMLDRKNKTELIKRIPNCTRLFQDLQQLASQPRSLKYLASLKLRRHLGVHLESAVKELPLPEILRDIVRIQKMDVDM